MVTVNLQGRGKKVHYNQTSIYKDLYFFHINFSLISIDFSLICQYLSPSEYTGSSLVKERQFYHRNLHYTELSTDCLRDSDISRNITEITSN